MEIFDSTLATPGTQRRYSFAGRRSVVRRSVKFGLKTSAPDLTPLFSDSLAGASAERVRQELESSFCRALAETFIGISSANTASALRARSAPNSYLLHLRAVEMINNRLSSAQNPASAITTSVI